MSLILLFVKTNFILLDLFNFVCGSQEYSRLQEWILGSFLF